MVIRMESIKPLQPAIPAKFQQYESLLRSNARRVVALNLRGVKATNNDEFEAQVAANPTSSRIGGQALVSATHPWPVDTAGKPMMFLAQLNLAELPPLEGHPTDGMLQFFHANDDCYGYEEGHLVRYLSPTDLPGTHLEGSIETQTDSIVGGYFEIEGQLLDQLPTYEDFQTIKMPEELADKDADFYDMTSLNPTNNIYGNGWAYFTQWDPRDGSDPVPANARLLFQVDTSYDEESKVEIMFGDVGVVNFFITAEDLAEQRFDRTYFSFDCC